MADLERSELANTLESIDVRENYGYRDEALLEFLNDCSEEAETLYNFGLVFPDDGGYRFPTPLSSEEEETRDSEKLDQASRSRIGRHTVATGRTMNHLLRGIQNVGLVDLDNEIISNATSGSILHDALKLPEMRLRSRFPQDPDEAHRITEAGLLIFVGKLKYDPIVSETIKSVGHNGAKDFLRNGTEIKGRNDILRQCAYLVDVFMEETTITADPLGKCRRLLSDPRYREQNIAGFPKMRNYPGFTFEDGSLRPKFDIQLEVTMRLADNIAQLLGIRWQDLTKYLIKTAADAGEYDARFSSFQDFQIPSQQE